MKLFISAGAPEIFMVLLFLLIYGGLFTLAVYIMRSIFRINKFEKYQTAQLRLLAEIAKEHGVDEDVLREIESTLE